jgi:hypothetical protein
MILSNKFREAVLEADIARLEADAAMRNFTDQLLFQQKSGFEKALVWGEDALFSTGKTLQSGFDLSAPFIQGLQLLLSGNVKAWAKAWGPMMKGLVKGEDYAVRQLAEIKRHPLYPALRKAGLQLTEVGGKMTVREEQFAGRIIDEIANLPNATIVGAYAKGIKKSEAAFTAFNNAARFGLASKLAAMAPQNAPASELAAFYRDIAAITNVLTGRGTGYMANKIMGSKPLAMAFYAPRFLWSTMQTGLPVFALRLESKQGKKAFAKEWGKLGAAGASILAFAKFVEEKTGKDGDPLITVDTDIRSSRFGRIAIPATGFEIGLFDRIAAPGKVLAQMAYGKISKSGNYKPSSSYNSPEFLLRFIYGKASPTVKFGTDFLTQEQYDFKKEETEPFNVRKQILNMTSPITWRSMFEDVTDKEASLIAKYASLLQLTGLPLQNLPKKTSGGAPPLDLRKFGAQPKKSGSSSTLGKSSLTNEGLGNPSLTKGSSLGK